MDLAQKLLQWYQINKRKLPWRKNTTPYNILVSEIMLQQTRVEAVVTKYQEFLRQFPTVETLAKAPLNDVLKAWEGLGYYRRAKSLKKACEIIYFERNSDFPKNSSELKSLPGIGEYTSAAIASIAFNEPTPVIDGNVIRIICRLFALHGNPYLSKTLMQIKDCFESGFFIGDQPGDFNQAMMELGAIVCTPKSPKCSSCPLELNCKARNEDLIDQLPELRKKEKPIIKYLYFLIWPDSQFGIRLINKTWKNYQEGYLTLPWVEKNGKVTRDEIRDSFSSQFSIDIKDNFVEKSFRHSITNYKLNCTLVIPEGCQDLVITKKVLESGLMKKALKLLSK